MAPLKKQQVCMEALFQICLANYGSSTSSHHVAHTQRADDAGVSEAAGLSAPAQCHPFPHPCDARFDLRFVDGSVTVAVNQARQSLA
jgi:hypothetical protein